MFWPLNGGSVEQCIESRMEHCGCRLTSVGSSGQNLAVDKHRGFICFLATFPNQFSTKLDAIHALFSNNPRDVEIQKHFFFSSSSFCCCCCCVCDVMNKADTCVTSVDYVMIYSFLLLLSSSPLRSYSHLHPTPSHPSLSFIGKERNHWDAHRKEVKKVLRLHKY